MASIKFRLRFTIGTKLVGLVAILLMGSVLSLVWLCTQMFVESDTALIQQANADSATNLATQMRELFQDTTEKIRILGTVMLQNEKSPTTKSTMVTEFFSKDKDLLSVFVFKTDSPAALSKPMSRGISPEMNALGDPTGEVSWEAIQHNKDFSLNSVAEGEVQLSSFSLPDGDSAIALAVPFMQDALNPARFTHILVALMRQNRFVKAFAESDVVTSFMVDRKGRLLAHPDPELVNSHANLSNLAIVKEMLGGKFNNGQTRYEDPQTHEAKLGAFRTVGFGGLGVVAEVAEAKAFEGARKVVYRAALVAWIILCISFMAGYLYSGTITWPIRRLSDAAHRISEGDFKINLRAKGQDEIAHLATSFNEMAKGLEERDRVKETFNKFHNKEIAEKLLSGEVKLGGERKEATVFFSDVRGFTGMSESMQPEEVVEMLNEYMTRMVAIIRSHKGVVDKYVGDAIMALWGVPLTGEDDSYNAVRACLAMREDLAKLNELRISRGQPVIKIGMGLNSGPLIAGNIGSDEKMEYTVIGDAVNLASRIESMTKEYGTDLLISKSVHDRVMGRFIFEEAAATRVKGKSEAIEVFKIQGYIDEKGNAVIIQTPYSSYKAEKSDKVVHDPNHPAPAEEPLESAKAVEVAHNTSAGLRRPGTQPSMVAPAPSAAENAPTMIIEAPRPAATPPPKPKLSVVPPSAPAKAALAPTPAPASPSSPQTAQPEPSLAVIDITGSIQPLELGTLEEEKKPEEPAASTEEVVLPKLETK